MDKTLATPIQPAQGSRTGDPLARIHELDRLGEATMVVPGEYLEVVVARRGWPGVSLHNPRERKPT
jgi:hypothetical protein